ncbi:MAG: hypothetical protein ACI86H_000942 [bacterium]|jgi:hypothetical protein
MNTPHSRKKSDNESVDSIIDKYYSLMLDEGLPRHKYRYFTLEESYVEYGNTQTKSKIIPNSALQKKYRPNDILDERPHGKGGSTFNVPTLRQIDVAFTAKNSKKITNLLRSKLLGGEAGKKVFESLYDDLKYTVNENILSASSHIESIGVSFKKGYLHSLLLYYLGVLTFSMSVSGGKREEVASKQTLKIRYVQKCYQLFLYHSKKHEKDLLKEKDRVGLAGIKKIKRYIQRFQRKYLVADDIPNYKQLEKERTSLSRQDQLGRLRQFLLKSKDYFYYQGMLHAANLMKDVKLQLFKEIDIQISKPERLGGDPTGYETIANILYMMSLVYTHPKVDRKQIVEAVKFFNTLNTPVKISPIDPKILHLGLARAAYHLENVKVLEWKKQFRKNRSIQDAIIRMELKGVAEKCFRFELLRYDFYSIPKSHRDFKLTLKHISKLTKTYPDEYRVEIHDFTIRIHTDGGSLTKLREAERSLHQHFLNQKVEKYLEKKDESMSHKDEMLENE